VRALSERGNVERGLVSVVSSPFLWIPPFWLQFIYIIFFKLSFATSLMQLKNVTWNYLLVACDTCNCIRQVTKDSFSTCVSSTLTSFLFLYFYII